MLLISIYSAAKWNNLNNRGFYTHYQIYAVCHSSNGAEY